MTVCTGAFLETYKSQVEQNKVDVSTYQAYGYTDEQIQSQLETNQGKIDEVYYSAIQSAEAKIAEADQQIKSIDAQLAAVSGGQDSYEVKATASGVLHMLGNYKSGMVCTDNDNCGNNHTGKFAEISRSICFHI